MGLYGLANTVDSNPNLIILGSVLEPDRSESQLFAFTEPESECIPDPVLDHFLGNNAASKF